MDFSGKVGRPPRDQFGTVHLGVSTVGLILKEKPIPSPTVAEPHLLKKQVVTSKYPNHLWQTDLTVVPIGPGSWTGWLPFSLPQCWPFSWWLAVVMDHYSRRIMGVTLFRRAPTSKAVRRFLARVTRTADANPKHLVTDRGSQFDCEGFRSWCQKRGIKPRFGAVGRHGSIAVIERLILTLKQNLAWMVLVPLRREVFQAEVIRLALWYNKHRPHMTLAGKTLDEVYDRQRWPANRQPRFEPRPGWHRRSPCARPVTLVKGKPSAPLEFKVVIDNGRKHLPIVVLKRAA